MGARSKKLIFLCLMLFAIFSSCLINSQLNPVSGEISPLIYTESERITFSQGSSKNIVWIVIDNDPKKYWITNTFENDEVLLQSEKTFTTSKIEIRPVGIPIGNNIIKLYIEDFSNLISISEVEIIVFAAPTVTHTTAATSSSPTTIIDEDGGAAGIFLSIPAFMGLVFIRLIRKKIKRRENE